MDYYFSKILDSSLWIWILRSSFYIWFFSNNSWIVWNCESEIEFLLAWELSILSLVYFSYMELTVFLIVPITKFNDYILSEQHYISNFLALCLLQAYWIVEYGLMYKLKAFLCAYFSLYYLKVSWASFLSKIGYWFINLSIWFKRIYFLNITFSFVFIGGW